MYRLPQPSRKRKWSKHQREVWGGPNMNTFRLAESPTPHINFPFFYINFLKKCYIKFRYINFPIPISLMPSFQRLWRLNIRTQAKRLFVLALRFHGVKTKESKMRRLLLFQTWRTQSKRRRKETQELWNNYFWLLFSLFALCELTKNISHISPIYFHKKYGLDAWILYA